MIVNVQGPVFQRFTGNEDPDTFDIIRIEILLRAFFDNSIELCREHKDELLDAAIDKLKSSVKFRNFGAPINFLKVYDIVLTQDHRGNPAFVPERSQLILLHSCVMIRRPDTSGERIRFIFSRIVSYNRSRTPRVASREMGRPTVFQTEYRPAAGLTEAYC